MTIPTAAQYIRSELERIVRQLDIERDFRSAFRDIQAVQSIDELHQIAANLLSSKYLVSATTAGELMRFRKLARNAGPQLQQHVTDAVVDASSDLIGYLRGYFA